MPDMNQPSAELVSCTLTNLSGQTETRQTPEAFKATYAEKVASIRFHRNASGTIAKSIYNTIQAIGETPGLDELFGKNMMNGDIVARYTYDSRNYGFGNIQIEADTRIDENMTVLIEFLVNGIFQVDFGMEKIRQAIERSAARFQIHPIRDYLTSLRWDGQPRIDTWLTDFAGAEDTVYTRAAAAKWLIQAVARGMKPGCHADSVLILEGGQGLGKNTLMEALLPNADWTVSLHSNDINKDLVTSLEGKWFAEFAEMHTATRSEIKALKAFITQRTDTYRKAYRRDHISNRRLTVFWGGTNDSEYLQDETGNRRFWPIEVKPVVPSSEPGSDGRLCYLDRDSVEEIRDQLWAEAYQRFKDGEDYTLAGVERELAEEKQAEKLIVDPWEDDVRAFLFPPGGARVAQIGTGDVLGAGLGLDVSKRTLVESRRVGKILRKLGYKSQTVDLDGEKARRWVRKPE